MDPEIAARASFQLENLTSKQSGRVWWDPFEDVARHSTRSRANKDKERRRSVWLYFRSVVGALKNLFLSRNGSEADQAISHVISINTCDDTNIKMLADQRNAVEVRSVMSNIQHHLLVKDKLAEEQVPVWLVLHQPLIALHRATASHLGKQFLSWVLSFCGNVGHRLAVWGLPSDLFKFVRQHVFIFISDALRANDVVFKDLLQRAQRQARDYDDNKTTILHIHCSIHQASLILRTVVLGFPGFWSTLVRLGHLFESHSFRQRFRAAMTKVIHQHFVYMPVDELPPEVIEWKRKAIQHLHMASALPRRLKHLMQHLQKDNGDAAADQITHRCTGQACCPGGEQEVLSFLIQSFCNMFDHMCTPLLYRWKHAPDAMNFVRDGFFLHGVLPKTLEAIPTVKGASAFC